MKPTQDQVIKALSLDPTKTGTARLAQEMLSSLLGVPMTIIEPPVPIWIERVKRAA